MSASQYRSQLENKRKQRTEADGKAGRFRSKESAKRADAAKARLGAGKASNATTVSSKLREAERREKEAAAAGKEASRWQTKATSYAKEEMSLSDKLLRAEKSDADAAERRRRQGLHQADRRAASERAELETRLGQAESSIGEAIGQLRAPKQEKLRVLLLGASADGGLRVGREQRRIRAAVQAALHRDQIELDVRPAATTSDLLDGITRFRPHVVHFSGHSNRSIIEFEDDVDEPNDGVVVTAEAFGRAVGASDDPPVLVLLNSCDSAEQIDDLVEAVVPFAIGMSDEIGDGDAIIYAAQFYAAVANGQSIRSAHLSGQAALELAGLVSAELPRLAWAHDVDPAVAVLVEP